MRTKLINLLNPALLIGPVMCYFLSSCGTDERTAKAIEWVNSHPKPIIVTSVSMNGLTLNYRCMFKDSAGIVFYAGEVKGFEPDTIKLHITAGGIKSLGNASHELISRHRTLHGVQSLNNRLNPNVL